MISGRTGPVSSSSYSVLGHGSSSTSRSASHGCTETGHPSGGVSWLTASGTLGCSFRKSGSGLPYVLIGRVFRDVSRATVAQKTAPSEYEGRRAVVYDLSEALRGATKLRHLLHRDTRVGFPGWTRSDLNHDIEVERIEQPLKPLLAEARQFAPEQV